MSKRKFSKDGPKNSEVDEFFRSIYGWVFCVSKTDKFMLK